MAEFKPGDTIKAIDGNSIKIIKFLASGGQGDVYENTKAKEKLLNGIGLLEQIKRSFMKI